MANDYNIIFKADFPIYTGTYFTSFVQALQVMAITKAHSCKYEMYRRGEVRAQNRNEQD